MAKAKPLQQKGKPQEASLGIWEMAPFCRTSANNSGLAEASELLPVQFVTWEQERRTFYLTFDNFCHAKFTTHLNPCRSDISCFTTYFVNCCVVVVNQEMRKLRLRPTKCWAFWPQDKKALRRKACFKVGTETKVIAISSILKELMVKCLAGQEQQDSPPFTD